MLRPGLAAGIDGIANDRTSGAAELALRAADLLALAQPEELEAAAQAVMRAQPAMASVYNAAQAALAGSLAGFVQRLRRSGEAIASAGGHLVLGKTVLTHSYSSTVVRLLQQNAPSRVFCTESLPGGEGRATAAEVNGTIIPDDDIHSVLSGADLVALGADAVTPDAVVNKVGTARIVLAAREHGVPAWVFCGKEKMVPADWRADLGDFFELTPRSWFAGLVDDS